MPNTRDIKRRIKSITNTKKVTHAMEMVAAAKMRKAIEAVLCTRNYASLSWSTVLNLSLAESNGEILHPLLAKRKEIKKVAIVLITSNRGLCGSFNSAIINKVHQSVQKYQEKDGQLIIPVDFILLGKKGAAVYKYFGYNLAADFPKPDLIEEVIAVVPVVKLIISEYLADKYDKVMLAYTDFVSPAKQIPRLKQLLPIEITTQDERLGFVEEKISELQVKDEKTSVATAISQATKIEYLFEPSPAEVLDQMLPRLIEIQLYQAVLEANASEHSARMTAMRQATDAAGEMIDELILFFNKARQASITAELAEISATVNALAE